MKRADVLSFLLLLTLNVLCAGKDVEIKSPSEKLMVKIIVSEPGLKLNLFNSNKLVLQAEVGSFVFDKNVLLNAYTISNIKQTSKDEEWKPVYGERNSVRDRYNELEITLTDKGASKITLQLIMSVLIFLYLTLILLVRRSIY